MNGKTMLMKIPQEVKDIIIKRFGSLDYFYGYVYQLHINQYVYFKKTHEMNDVQIDRLKEYLENAGVDFMLACDLVDEIGGDFSELVAENNIKIYLGENWKEKLEEFDRLIDQY